MPDDRRSRILECRMREILLYNVWMRTRNTKKGGGVLLLIKKELKVDNVIYGEGRAEVLKVGVRRRGGSRRDFAVVYVPPKTNSWRRDEYEQMTKDTIMCLKRLVSESENVTIMGDFNCKEISWENWSTEGSELSWGNELLQLAMDNILTQWVQEPTRFQGNAEPARLDLVFTKEPEIVESMNYQSPIGKSDHVLIEFKLGADDTEEGKDHKEGTLNFSKANFVELRKHFGEVNWAAFHNARGTEEKWRLLLEIYEDGIRKCVPKRQVKKEARQVWYNRRCEQAKIERDHVWNRWRKSRKHNHWINYKDKRNEYVNIRKIERINYEKDIVEKCKDQPKLFYGYVNGKLKKKKGISKLKRDDVIYEDAEQIAEVMNGCFQSVFTRESEFVEQERPDTGEGLCRLEVSVEEVKMIMEKLDKRKAMGPDGVSNWILRECSDQLADKIHAVLVSSFEENVVPLDWKKADIVPIFKGGNDEDPLNYRPVSLTSVVAKIGETIIKERWMKHLEQNNILTNKQFGFREGRSCTTNLISFYSRVIDAVQERDGWVDCIYLDLKKAFDKVPHKRLLWKLETIGGLKGGMLKWFEDFLKNRQMRTLVKGKKSAWKQVTSGVPQGSVLAPVMFAVYVNDMVEGIGSYVSLFADDAKLLRKIERDEDCVALQQDLERIWDWSRKWEMEFNTKKCSVVEFGRSTRRPRGIYSMGNECIKKKTEEKDLGVIIMDSLSPEKHINKITAETYNLLRNIRAAFNYMDEEMTRKLITSLIRPRLEYAALVWSPNLKKHIRKLERIQRAASKLPPNLRNQSYEERLRALNLTTLEQRRERGDLIAVYRSRNGLEKFDNEDLMIWDTRATRGHGMKLKKSSSRRDIKKFSFPHRCVEVWNALDEEVVSAKTLHNFKERLDNYRYGDGTIRA